MPAEISLRPQRGAAPRQSDEFSRSTAWRGKGLFQMLIPRSLPWRVIGPKPASSSQPMFYIGVLIFSLLVVAGGVVTVMTAPHARKR